MDYDWKFKRTNPLVAQEYESHGIPQILGQIMFNRGISYRDYQTIINDFWELVNTYCDNIPGIHAVAKRINRALLEPNTKIFVFSDYDTDGITSAGIFYEFCKTLSQELPQYYNKIDIYIPERLEGYGLNDKYCINLVERKKRETDFNYLVITFDNGITKNDQVAYLSENGIEVIITDHHEPDGEIPLGIVVDPKKDDKRLGEELCGAGIAWLIVYQLYKTIINNNQGKKIDFTNLGRSLQRCLGYATVGTVGDMMPMTLFNLSLLYNGLAYLNNIDLDNKSVIHTLSECFGLKEITTKDIGFSLSAAINACGQMGEANTAFKLFIAQNNSEQLTCAQDICSLLNKSRDETKQAKKIIEADLQKSIFKNDLFCIYIMENIPHGIAGKLANYIAENTGKPSLVLVDMGDEEIKGSGRCQNETIDMLAVLKVLEKQDIIKSANGHQAACGVSFYKNKIDQARQELNKILLLKIENNEIMVSPHRDLYIDAIISVKDINIQNYNIINSLPYSMNFYSPNLCIKGYIVKARSSSSNVNNICYTIKDLTNNNKIDIWVWNKKAQEYFDTKPNKISLVGNLVRNFMNPKQITLDVVDIKFI